MNVELTPEHQPTRPATGVGPGTPVRRDRERLARLLAPRSVALIGVSDDPARLTGRPLRYLRAAGFPGPVYAVNPRHRTVQGQPSYRSVDELPAAPDLACVMVPAGATPAAIAECARRGTGGAIVFSGGFAEAGEEGRQLQQRVLEAAGGMPVIGPNSVGLVSVAARAVVSPSLALERFVPEPGPIALVSQSGGMLGALLSRGSHRGLRFSHLISTGNEADLDAFDFADLLLDDPSVRVIAVFLEAIRNTGTARRVAERAATLRRPLVVYKIGRSGAGQRAAASHTGALVGTDAVWSAFFRQCSMIRVATVEGLLEVANFLAKAVPLRGTRVAVLTSTGGAASVIADRCGELGLELPPPDAASTARLAAVLPGISPRANPIDLTLAGLDARVVGETCAALVGSGGYDALVAVLGSSSELHPEITARPLADGAPRGFPVAVYVNPQADETVRFLESAGLATFRTPEACAEALRLAHDYGRALAPRHPAASAEPVAGPAWLPSGGGVLTEWEAHRLFGHFGVPMARARVARACEEARAAAAEIGYPVAVKAVTRLITHKSEHDAVVLGVADDPALDAAVTRLLRTIPGTEGVLLMEMVPAGVDLVLGVKRDPQVGLVLAVGLGGVAVEVYADIALRVLPVSREDVEEMLRELRGVSLLRGVRGRPPADVKAVTEAAVAFARMAESLGERLLEAEINPLIALPDGARGVDAVATLASAPAVDEPRRGHA